MRMVGHPPVDGEGGQVSSIFRRTRIYIGLLICRLQLEEDQPSSLKTTVCAILRVV